MRRIRRPSGDAGGEQIGDNHHSVRKALVEKAEDKEEAEAVTNTMVGSLISSFKSIWSDPKEKPLAEQWAEQEKEKKEDERRRQREEKEAREQRERDEQREREELNESKRLWDEHFAEQERLREIERASAAEDRASAAVERGRSSQSASSGRRKSSTPRRTGKSTKSPAVMPDFAGAGKTVARALLSNRGF